MLRVRIDANDRSCEPAFAFPKFGIEKNLHPVADLELDWHVTLFTTACPEHKTDPYHNKNATIDRPLRLAGHETAGQNINSLEEENSTCKDEDYAQDVQKCFHNIATNDLGDYTH